MVKLGTKCNDCCFFYENTKCKHDLIEKFIDAGAEIFSDNDGISIDRICQYKRPNDWNIDKSDDEKLKICQNEVYITGNIVVLAESKEDLAKIKELKNASNFKHIVLYRNIKSKDLLDICGNNFAEYKCILMAEDNLELQVYSAIKYAKNGLFIIIDCKKPFDKNLIDKLNNVINKKMFRLLHVCGTDGLHQSVNVSHLYKYIKGDLQFSMKYKIEEIAKEENSDPQIFTWKEINEEYIN